MMRPTNIIQVLCFCHPKQREGFGYNNLVFTDSSLALGMTEYMITPTSLDTFPYT